MSKYKTVDVWNRVFGARQEAYDYAGVGVGSSRPYFVGNNGPFFVGKLGANQ